ncbi:MAG: ATP-binding protein [Oscillospiraceae bacterium]
MKRKIKFKMVRGIKRRWMFNSVLVILVIVVVAITAFSLSIAGYYYSSARTGLETKAQTATDFFANYITKTYAEYYDSAYRYTESFVDINTLELQFVSTEGRVQISSYGITSGIAPGTPDIEESLKTGSISSWVGRNSGTHERIMAVSAPMIYADGQVIGVMRYVTSMKLVDKEIMMNILVSVGVGFAALALVVLMNMFFIRSVVEPMNEITLTARRIADGSYGIQIGKKYRDETGDMVDAINEMSMKISQSEKTQTEFISSVSHELRTPLTAITGWGETLIYDESLDTEAKKGMAIILKEARRLTKMVEELLDFTRMQDGRFTLNMEVMDVGSELEESIFTYRELLKQDEIQLEYEPYEDELPLINGDLARLRQVFLNILDNAAKYARDGKRIVVSISANERYVSVKIRDFGPGIPEDELENVKMKFYKGSSKERGSGIGLAVCDEIIKYHEGTLKLSNAEGGGLLVEVRLPIRAE